MEMMRTVLPGLGELLEGTRSSRATTRREIVVHGDGKEQVIDHPNPEATLMETWDEWTIPLSDLTIDASKLDSITLGVGGSGATGKIYIDGIRVFRPYDQALAEE